MKFIILCSIILISFSCSKDDTTIEEIPLTITFTTNPIIRTHHNRNYEYFFKASSSLGNPLSYEVSHPEWISFDSNDNSVAGLAGWNNKEKFFAVRILATDGIDTAIQAFTINVLFANIICSQFFGDPDKSLYILPFNVDKTSKIMQSYCNRSNSHNNTFAYDFLLNMGDTIRASRAGTVVQIQEDFPDNTGISGQENYVYIEHKDGSVIRYVHLLQLGALVNKGEKVEQGQIIGLNGLSGGSPVPHLHFELFREFTWSDKRYALPVNFRNSEGQLDSNGGLMVNLEYTAKDYQPNND